MENSKRKHVTYVRASLSGHAEVEFYRSGNNGVSTFYRPTRASCKRVSDFLNNIIVDIGYNDISITPTGQVYLYPMR